MHAPLYVMLNICVCVLWTGVLYHESMSLSFISNTFLTSH